MKTWLSRLALILLAVVLSSPALAQDVNAAKTCKPGSTKGNCLLALITTLQGQVATLQTALTSASTNITTLQTALTAVQNNHALALGSFVSVDANAENGLAGPNIVISGANVHIESGSGTTVDTTGLGNLVVGYDEDSLAASTIDPNRTGSNNLVVGPIISSPPVAERSSASGTLISSDEASITAGDCNAAGGTAFPSSLNTPCFNANPGIDSVSGGEANTSNGSASSVSGGFGNLASNQDASVSGGAFNTSSGADANVSGGESNTASGQYSSILGGASVTVSTANGSAGGGSFTP